MKEKDENEVVYLTSYGIEIPNEFIVLIENKITKKATPFIKLAGLIRIAHNHAKAMGGVLTQTGHKLVELPTKENGGNCIITTSFGVKIPKQDNPICEFIGVGDANPKNVTGEEIARHVIRVAESRSVARALRFLTDVGMTALEELDGTGYTAESDDYYKSGIGSNKANSKESQTRKFEDNEHKKLYEDMMKLKEELGMSNKELREHMSETKGEYFSGTKYDITKDEYRKLIENLKQSKKSTGSDESKTEPKNLSRVDLVQEIIVRRKKLGMSMDDFNTFAKEELNLKGDSVKAAELTDEQLGLLNEKLKEKTKSYNTATNNGGKN